MATFLTYHDPTFDPDESLNPNERLSLFSRSGLLSLPLTDNEQLLLGGSLGILSNQDTKAWTVSISETTLDSDGRLMRWYFDRTQLQENKE
jgi:hypothetical protein